MRSQQTKWGAEVVQDKLRDVVGWSSMAGKLGALDPVREGEVTGGTIGEVDDGEAGRAFAVFFEDDNGGVFAIGGEGGDFA